MSYDSPESIWYTVTMAIAPLRLPFRYQLLSYNGYTASPGKRTERLAEDAGEDKGNTAQGVERKGKRLREVPARLSGIAERFQRSET